jgi:hypothetical protein
MTMMRHQLIVAMAVAVLVWALWPGTGLTASEDQPGGSAVSTSANPAGGPQAAAPSKVTVVSVSGPAEKLLAGKGTWQPLRAGEELDELTVIRTGLAARVTLKFADRAEAIIEGASKAGIREFRKTDTAARGRLGLKYGAMHVSVDRSRGPVDFQVATPVAIMSVRGTSGIIGFSSDAGLGVQGASGTWQVAASQGSRSVSETESTDSDLSHPVDLGDRRRHAPLGDVSGGLSQMELMNLRTGGDGRGMFGFIPGGTGEAQGLPIFSPEEKEDHIEPYPEDGGNEYPGEGNGVIIPTRPGTR